MKFQINRENLLKPLQLVAGVVEKRQTLPILANVLLTVNENGLTLTGTDTEVELQGYIPLEQKVVPGAITVPARKLMDICRSLPEQAILEFSWEDPKLLIRSGKSRFSLITLPAAEFPNTTEVAGQLEFVISQQALHKLIESTQFAMAQQDVRFYLNGMLLEMTDNVLRAVATDGHRMALTAVDADAAGGAQIIIPRKAVLELTRLLVDTQGDVVTMLGSNHIRVKTNDYIFTSKLIDGRFPDYEKVLPARGDKILQIERDLLKQALSRVAILANEKHRSVRFNLLKEGFLRIAANNPEQEEAEEELGVDYKGDDIEIGFNVNYLLDAISALPAGLIKFTLSTPDQSIRIESAVTNNSVYVIMPMCL